MHEKDLPMLKTLLKSSPDEIEQAGLHPTPDQIELFAYHLPTYNLSNLIVSKKLLSIGKGWIGT